MDTDKLFRMGMMAAIAVAALAFAGMGMLDMRTAFEIAGGAASLSLPSVVTGATALKTLTHI